MDSLELFCSNKDIKSLKCIDLYTVSYLLKLCIDIINNEKKADKNGEYIARIVTNHFKIKFYKEIATEDDESRKVYKLLGVNFTGARKGDILVGRAKVTLNAMIKISESDVLPYYSSIMSLRDHPKLYSQTIEKLKSIEYFRDRSKDYIDKWLLMYANPKKEFIGEDLGKEELKILLLQPGESDFNLKLDTMVIETLMEKEHTAKEVEDFFPKKAGSKAKHHTLLFIKSWWRIYSDADITFNFRGDIIDIYSGKVLECLEGTRMIITEIDNREIGFVSIDREKPTFKELKRLIGKFTKIDDFGIFDILDLNFKGYTPASYKSLLQKSIRFKAEYTSVFIDTEYTDMIDIDTRIIVLYTFIKLLTHKGSFVPDIQKFVSGLESATKRLAVTIFEDSKYISETDSISLLGAALLSQRSNGFSPCIELVEKWMKTAIEAYNSNEKYIFHLDTRYEYFDISSSNTIFENSSAILDRLKSFKTDLNMVNDYAVNGVSFTSITPGNVPKVMPIYHAVDFHWASDIAYYYPEKYIIFEKDFGKFYGNIFKNITGVNPRNSKKSCIDFKNFENNEFVRATREAQYRYTIHLQYTQKERESTGEYREYSFTLNDSWLAGLIGNIEYKDLIITLKYDNIYLTAVCKRPSREIKDGSVPSHKEIAAINFFKEKISKGIKFNSKNLPSDDFIGKYLILHDDEYYITENPKDSLTFIPWTSFKNIKIKVPIYKYTNIDSLRYWGTGIEENAEESFQKFLENTDISILRKIYSLINNFEQDITMNKINREGKGLHYTVSITDVKAFQKMLEISKIYPGALSPKKYSPVTFRVNTPMLLWNITESIKKYISTKSVFETNWKIYDSKIDSRNMWEHQENSLNEMISNSNAGSKGNFIFIPVGLGKTFLFIKYIQYLHGIKGLPPYIVYTLPSSAIQSLIKEFNDFGFKVDLHIPLKSIGKKNIPTGAKIIRDKKISPFVITMIEHDYLRRMSEELIDISENSLLVVDEVHKTLNETQRTSIALELSYLCKEFVVMTGTPVIDNKIYKLLAWLKQIVPFTLTLDNFWVAVNSMISRKANTGVITVHRNILVKMDSIETQQYQKLVSKNLGGFNTNTTIQDINNAINICYSSCTREMISFCKEKIDKGDRVMLVAKNIQHQGELYKKFESVYSVDWAKMYIYILEKGGSVILTDTSPEKYKLVIVTIRQSEGYTLTRMNIFISSIYPSNNAVREQLEGRINRIGQKSREVEYYYFHCGVLTHIMERYANAKSLSMAIKSMAKDI